MSLPSLLFLGLLLLLAVVAFQISCGYCKLATPEFKRSLVIVGLTFAAIVASNWILALAVGLIVVLVVPGFDFTGPGGTTFGLAIVGVDLLADTAIATLAYAWALRIRPRQALRVCLLQFGIVLVLGTLAYVFLFGRWL